MQDEFSLFDFIVLNFKFKGAPIMNTINIIIWSDIKTFVQKFETTVTVDKLLNVVCWKFSAAAVWGILVSQTCLRVCYAR